MLDASIVQQCADPSLKPGIVEQFIARAGSKDPLAVTVRSGNRVVLVPKPTTPEEALALIRDNLGRTPFAWVSPSIRQASALSRQVS